MLSWIILFMVGLGIAMIYNMIADKKDHATKLDRIQKEIARREALEKSKNTKEE